MNFVAFAGCASCIAVMSSSASAQEPGSASDAAITVTATRQAAPIEAVPMSIAVIDAAQLGKAIGYLGAEDITDLLPGVEAAVANGSQVAFQIRGIGAVDHQALTPTAAAVYSDGVYLATNVQTGALLYDLERVEVLKGPQGSLYGRNASGGAINLISRRPTEETEGFIELGYGNFERFDANLAIGGGLADGLSARLAAKYLKRGPVLNNVAGPSEAGGERDEFGLRLSALLDRGGASLLLRAHYEADNGINPTPRNDALELGQHQIASAGDGVQDTRNAFYGVSAEFETDLAGWEIFSLTAFEGYRQNYGFDFDGTVAPFGIGSLNANLSYDRDFTQLSNETRVLRRTAWGSVMFGGSAAYEKFDQRYTIWCGELDAETLIGSCNYVGAPGRVGPDPASDAAPSTLVTDIAQERTALALFSFNEIDLTGRLSLTLGARLTAENIQGEGQGFHVFTDGVRALNNRDGAGPAAGSNRIRDTRLSGNAALSYRTGNGQAYASVSNGYKSGGFNGEVANNAAHYSDEGLFRQETVTAYELGYKSSGSPVLAYSLAAFYQDYDNPQARIFVQFPLPDGSTIVSNSLSNLDRAESYGVEADVKWRPINGLKLDAGAVWNRTRIRQQSAIGGNAALFDGNPLPFAPEFSAVMGASYRSTLSQALELDVSANGKYRSAYFLDAEGLDTRKQNGFLTAQAQLSLRFVGSGTAITFWGRNLTGRDYALSGYGFIGYNTFRSDPRTYGVKVSHSF